MIFKNNSVVQTQQMWSIANIQSRIAFFGSLFLAIFFRNRNEGIMYSCLMMAAVSGANLAILFYNRIKQPKKLAASIYIVNVVACSIGVLINHHYWLLLGVPFEGFFGFKLMAVLVCMQAPMIAAIGWASLSILFLTPLLQYLVWTPEQQKLLGLQEPGFTLVVVLCCGIVYFHRLKIIEMIQRQAQIQANEAELRRFAHFLLGAQHLINSPLQVIEASVDLIRIKHPETEPLVRKIENAFEPIRHVSRLLSFGRKHLNWDEVNIALSIEDLEKEIQMLSTESAPPLQ